jgi:hypothetical protein
VLAHAAAGYEEGGVGELRVVLDVAEEVEARVDERERGVDEGEGGVRVLGWRVVRGRAGEVVEAGLEGR